MHPIILLIANTINVTVSRFFLNFIPKGPEPNLRNKGSVILTKKTLSLEYSAPKISLNSSPFTLK